MTTSAQSCRAQSTMTYWSTSSLIEFSDMSPILTAGSNDPECVN